MPLVLNLNSLSFLADQNALGLLKSFLWWSKFRLYLSVSKDLSVSVSDGRFSLTMFGIVVVAKLVWVAVASSVTRFGKKVFGQFSMLNKYVAKFRTCLGKFSLLQLAKD